MLFRFVYKNTHDQFSVKIMPVNALPQNWNQGLDICKTPRDEGAVSNASLTTIETACSLI